jgi:branched-chain amino acid transport system permease protein
MMQGGAINRWLPWVVIGLLALFPVSKAPSTLQLLTKVLIMAIFAMSLDLLVGYTGLVSFGHAAYFGLAGYALALMGPKYEAASLWWTLPGAIGVCVAFALVTGLVVLRTRGIYFIMVTLAFAQMPISSSTTPSSAAVRTASTFTPSRP